MYSEAKTPSTAKTLILLVGNWKTYGLNGSTREKNRSGYFVPSETKHPIVHTFHAAYEFLIVEGSSHWWFGDPKEPWQKESQAIKPFLFGRSIL